MGHQIKKIGQRTQEGKRYPNDNDQSKQFDGRTALLDEHVRGTALEPKALPEMTINGMDEPVRQADEGDYSAHVGSGCGNLAYHASSIAHRRPLGNNRKPGVSRTEEIANRNIQ